MGRWWTAGVLLAIATWAGGCASMQAGTPGHDGSDEVIAGDRAVLVVHGMSCPLCANNVDEQLLAVPGVTAVSLDMGSGEATVTLDGTGRTTRGQLADAIDRSGFTLRDVRMP
jgi:copper chaperone CopZ